MIVTQSDDDKGILIKELNVIDSELWRIKAYYDVITSIVEADGQEKIFNYLTANNYKEIAVYGVGTVGKILFDSIKDSFLDITLIDKNTMPNYCFGDKKIMSPYDLTGAKFDVVIITPVHAFDTIKEFLDTQKIKNCISVQDIFVSDIGSA